MNFDLPKGIAVLERTPEVLNKLLLGLSKDWTKKNEGGETWSPYDVIGHLIHGEKTDWLARTKIILGNVKDKTFQSFNRFAHFENSTGKNLKELLEEFESLRNKNIQELKALNLTEIDLNKEGIHPELGPVKLKELLAAWVTHDLGHIAQICRVMAKQYKNEVGPWGAYITILND